MSSVYSLETERIKILKNKTNLQLNKQLHVISNFVILHCSATKVNKTEHVDHLGH